MDHHLQERLAALIQRLAETEAELEQLTRGQLDVVIDQAGHPRLLESAQKELHERGEVSRKAVEMQLALINALPARVALLDAEGNVQIVNRQWEQFAERYLEGVRGQLPGENHLVIQGELSEPVRVCLEALRRGVREVAEGERNEFTFEYACPVSEEGRWFECTASALTGYDLRGVAVMHREITEHKRNEARIRAQANLLDLASDAIVAYDMEERAEYWNKGAELMYGWKEEECRGRKVLPWLWESNEQRAQVKKHLVEHGEWLGEIEQKTKEEVKILVSSRWTLLRDENGTAKSFLSITRDITEKKRLENQFLRSQRMESIGVLASGIAHDLNNILSPVLLGVNMLREAPLPPHDKDFLKMMESSALRGASLVKQLLTFGRGTEEPRGVLQLGVVMQEVAGIARETFPKDISVACHVDANLWNIQGNPTQMHQMLLNLCLNARDAMPGGGQLTLSGSNTLIDETFAMNFPEARPGDYSLVKVADTGVGISDSLLDRVFDPFFTSKAKGEGSGLGLSTVHRIVKDHGGFITVRSQSGQGTVFNVFLPAVFEGRKKTDAAPAATEGLRGHGEWVLVIDDEANVRRATKAMLESQGYQVLLGEDGTSGLTAFMEHRSRIRVVVADLIMPHLNGVAMVRALRHLAPDLPILIMSGIGETQKAAGYQDELRSLGVGRIMPKPFSREQLLTDLRTVLESRTK